MPRAHEGPLRAARAQVMPHIPELAPQLDENRQVVREALYNAFVADGHDPSAVPERNWNKAERHTIFGFAIAAQTEFLVEGNGHEAHFKDFQGRRRGGSRKDFIADLRATQIMGARRVQQLYTEGPDLGHRWWPLAARRVRRLGYATIWRSISHPQHNAVTIDGLSLRMALRSRGLSGTVDGYIPYIKRSAPLSMSRTERVAASHDLAHLATSMGGLHAKELVHSDTRFSPMTVAEDGSAGSYRAVYENQKDVKGSRHRARKLPDVRLKCPAHVPHWTDNLQPDPYADTSLEDFLHAALNASVDYDVW